MPGSVPADIADGPRSPARPLLDRRCANLAIIFQNRKFSLTDTPGQQFRPVDNLDRLAPDFVTNRFAATRANPRSMSDHGLARMAANFVVGIEWGQAGSLCYGVNVL